MMTILNQLGKHGNNFYEMNSNVLSTANTETNIVNETAINVFKGAINRVPASVAKSPCSII